MTTFPGSTRALTGLLAALDARGYAFVTPTPTAVSIVRARPAPQPPSLRDIFGWSRDFALADLGEELAGLLEAAGALNRDGERFRSRVRVSTVAGRNYLHSAHPTSDRDSVFLGPDTYRFVSLLQQELGARQAVRSIFDIGAGAGVGGLFAASVFPDAAVHLGDINPVALKLAAANAAHAGVDVRVAETSGLAGAPTDLDLIVANPPYVAGESGRAYKDGGDLFGGRLSVDWALEAMDHLAPGGRFILYTGSAIQAGGADPIEAEIRKGLRPGFDLTWRELDPDVFSSELKRDAYSTTERIAAVAGVITRRPG